MKYVYKNQWLFMVFFISIAHAEVPTPSIGELIDQALKGKHREQQNIERDKYRHPKETLTYFGLQPGMTVVEIWPSKGWYTEILAPVLKTKGKYYAAGFSLTSENQPQWRREMQKEFQEKLKAHPSVYKNVILTELSVPDKVEIAPANTADMVLTFRNVHNWMKGDYADDVFAAMYKALAPGGVLGVVEHRAKPDTTIETMIATGYVTEDYVITLAAKAGFIYVGRSEINNNPKDTKEYPKGVWTLPPTLRLGNEDMNKYLAIGESDRMTLKFIKPVCY